MKSIKALFNRFKSPEVMETHRFPFGEALHFGIWNELISYKAIQTSYGVWKVLTCSYHAAPGTPMSDLMLREKCYKLQQASCSVQMDKDTYVPCIVIHDTSHQKIYFSRQAAMDALVKLEKQHYQTGSLNDKVTAFINHQQTAPHVQHYSLHSRASADISPKHMKKSP